MAGKKTLPILPLVEQPVVYCTWEGCLQKAVVCVEIEKGKGRHNLCEYHYKEAHHLRAERWCESRGLHTLEQKKEYCRAIAKELGIKLPILEREPGQDDEERTTSNG